MSDANGKSFQGLGAAAPSALHPCLGRLHFSLFKQGWELPAAADRKRLGIRLGSKVEVGQTDMEEQDGLNI